MVTVVAAARFVYLVLPSGLWVCEGRNRPSVSKSRSGGAGPMGLNHKDVQVAGAWSSRRRVFPVLGLLEILVLIMLIGACGKSADAGNVPSQSVTTSSGASGGADAGNAPSQSVTTSSGASGSAGEGEALSGSDMTSSGAPIGGDQVQPPSAATSPTGAPSNGLVPPGAPVVPPSHLPCSTSGSPGQACPATSPHTPVGPTAVGPTAVGPTPVGATPVRPTPAPASGLARAFSYPDSPAG